LSNSKRLIGQINSNCSTTRFNRCPECRTASACWIKHRAGWRTTRIDQHFQELDGLLRRPTRSLDRHIVDRWNVDDIRCLFHPTAQAHTLRWNERRLEPIVRTSAVQENIVMLARK